MKFVWKTPHKKLSPQVYNNPVENFFFPHIGLWRIFPCGSKQKSTYPHNFVLLLLRLPIPMIDISIFLNLTRKEIRYAFYL